MDTRVPLQPQPLSRVSHVAVNPSDNPTKPLRRSMSMAAAMSQQRILERPTPTNLKVRNAGKDFLKHDQTCQWIQFMQNQDPSPPTNKSRSQSISKNCSSATQKTTGSIDGVEVQPLKEAYYQTQLINLLKRQEDLSQRQKLLEDELHKQKMWQEQQLDHSHIKEQLTQIPLVISTDLTPAVTTHNIPRESRSKSPPFRRRLKGSVAKFCALRNEGCLEKVLYYRDNPTQIGDSEYHTEYARPAFQSSCSTSESTFDEPTSRQSRYLTNSSQRTIQEPRVKGGVSPATVGRRHAMAQESGLAVSQLITQSPRLV